MAFNFRLATLLKLREAARDERRRQLAQAQLAIDKLVNEQQEINRNLTSLSTTRRAESSGLVQVDRLIEVQRYDAVLRLSVETITKQMEIIQQEVERRKQALIEADREVRALEKLRDAQQQRWQQRESLAEVKQMDEAAGRAVAREI